MANFQRILEKVESEQIELQREIHLQEAELAKLNQKFSLNQNLKHIPEAPNTQLPFDDAIVELDQKLQQLDLLKEEVSQEQGHVLSQQNELRGAHQRLNQQEESLIDELATLTQHQQNLTDAWLDREAQQACEQAAIETEHAFLEKSITEQEAQQKSVSLTEQSFLSCEQELVEERNRVESWAEDLERQAKTLSDQQVKLSEQKQALESKQQPVIDQQAVQQNLTQQAEQLEQERDQLEEARRKLADQQAQLQSQTEELEQQQQSAQQVCEEFEHKNAALEERESQIFLQQDEAGEQRTALEQRLADLTSQEAALKTQLQNLEQQQENVTLQMSQLEEQQSQFESEKLEWTNARTALKQDQIAFESKTSEIAIQKEQQEDELQQQRVKFESERAQFAKQQADLEQDRTELDSNQQQIKEREQSLSKREAELKSLQEEIDQQKVKLDAELTSQKSQTEESQQAEESLKSERAQFAKQQADLEQDRTELGLKQEQLSEHDNSLTEREAQLAYKEQELDTLISEQESHSKQQDELDRQQAELEQKQDALKTQEDQLNTREQETSQLDHPDVDQQSALDELTSANQKLTLDHDQLTIDREEINHQRDNLESQRIQIQKDRGELEDREQILTIREQQLAERQEPINAVELPPIHHEENAIETDDQTSCSSENEEPHAHKDSSQEVAQNPGSLLESFMKDSTNETPEAKEEGEGETLQEKTGSLLDLFKKNSESETTDIEDITEQSSLVEAPVADTEKSDEQDETNPQNNEEDSDSVAEYMEKLLARSRGGKSQDTNSEASDSPQTSPVSSEPNKQDASLVTANLQESRATSTNNSMEIKLEALKKAPTHSQDKDAVRDALNSFRDVANHSARMAIARHTMKHRRTDFVFKGVLTGVCVLTTIIIFAESIWGANRLGIMKWAALAVSIASTAQFFRACHEARMLFRVKKSTKSTTTEEKEHSVSELQSVAEEDSLEEPLTAATGIHGQEELLSAEEDKVQLLEEQLQNSARAHHDQTASLSEEKNQSASPEIDLGVDQ